MPFSIYTVISLATHRERRTNRVLQITLSIRSHKPGGLWKSNSLFCFPWGNFLGKLALDVFFWITAVDHLDSGEGSWAFKFLKLQQCLLKNYNNASDSGHLLQIRETVKSFFAWGISKWDKVLMSLVCLNVLCCSAWAHDVGTLVLCSHQG